MAYSDDLRDPYVNQFVQRQIGPSVPDPWQGQQGGAVPTAQIAAPAQAPTASVDPAQTPDFYDLSDVQQQPNNGAAPVAEEKKGGLGGIISKIAGFF